MNYTTFVVSRFENRNGITSWRVTGWLHGLRIRKNFKTREEAAAEKAVLEIKALNAANGLHTIATVLTAEQVREAEALFHRLAGNTRPLSFYLDFALANYREPEKQKSLVDGITEYVAAKEAEFNQGHITRLQMSRIKSDLKRLQSHFPRKTVAEITSATLVAYLERAGGKLKTYNNRRGILGTFFKFAFHRSWVVENAMLRVPHHRLRRKRGMAQTLTAERAAALMEFLETYEGGRMVPYFALCLFAGVRPGVPDGEIHKLRPDAVNFDDGLIHISADVSKVREPRKVNIPPNLAAWLRAYPLSKFPLVVGNFQQRARELRQKFSLTHDVLRHTFISMFVAKYRSIGEAAIQAGNSEAIIRKHYLDLKSRAEAEEFYGILPKHGIPRTENETLPFVSATVPLLAG